MKTSESTLLNRLCREHAGAKKHVPVVEVDGYAAPQLLGHAAYYTTPAGKPVYHPSAYRSAYGKVVYHGSTRRVEVGRGWLARKLASLWHAEDRRRAKKALRLKLTTPAGIALDYALEHGRADLAPLFRRPAKLA